MSHVVYVDDRYPFQASLDEEWELCWVVSRKRHEISDVLVGGVGVAQLNRSFHGLGASPVDQVKMGLVPPRAYQLVVGILTYIPDVLSLQVMLVHTGNVS